MEKLLDVEALWYNRVRKNNSAHGAIPKLKHPKRMQHSLQSTVTQQSRKSNPRAAVVLAYLPALLMIRCLCIIANAQSVSDPDIERINAIVNQLRTQLGIPQKIYVTVVPADDRMVSVKHVPGKTGNIAAFSMSFDQHFLASLDEDELRAAVAHELGHVWIFTHHPYLQTEPLANEIAMRIVSRDSLKKIYTKLWAHLGVSGSLDEFLAEERQAGK